MTSLPTGTVTFLSGYALVLDGMAMRLAGGSESIQRQGGAHLARLNRQWAGFYPERLLSEPELSAAWEEGLAMDVAQLLDLAIAGPAEPQAGAARSRRGKTISA